MKTVSEVNDKSIAVIGLGFVGLTLAVVLAESGFQVFGIETNANTLKHLSTGRPHFYESGLSERFLAARENGSLVVASSIEAARLATAFVMTVGTPLVSGKPTMHLVEAASRDIATVLKDGDLVVLRSTVKVGTTRNVVLPILSKGAAHNFEVCFAPERTIEGAALDELAVLPQLLGALTPAGLARASAIFRKFTPHVVNVTSLEAAEFSKLTCNITRDISFAVANELALMCQHLGLDFAEVRRAATDNYPRAKLARQGLVGGPCLTKDSHILLSSITDHRLRSSVVATSRSMNESLPTVIFERIFRHISENKLINPKITICGLAFKVQPPTDDLRGSPSLDLIEILRNKYPSIELFGQDFVVSTPEIESLGLRPVANLDAAFSGTHILVIANNHPQYAHTLSEAMLRSMSQPALVYDCCEHIPDRLRVNATHGVILTGLGQST